MLIALILIITAALGVLSWHTIKDNAKLEEKSEQLQKAVESLNQQLLTQEFENKSIVSSANEIIDEYNALKEQLDKEKTQNSVILSQKKSSEVRLGNLFEHITPFLDECPYDPKDMHFLGMPVDFIVYSLDSADPAVIFLEVKTGKSQLSPTQKMIKKLIEKGAVRFEILRLSEKGIYTKSSK